jgi:glycosyltransferase involved in cell wall biosynthesis
MSEKNPLVSAIIPTKKRPKLLFRALQSVVNQTYHPLEVIVVDDGSPDEMTDETETIVKKFNGDIKYLKNGGNSGAAAARNRGIKAANGVFIAGLDDDDEWYPERIELLMKAYDETFSCVTSDVAFQYSKRSAVYHKQRYVTLNDLLYTNHVGNQALVERERLLELDGFDEQLEAAQDYDLWIRLCERFGPTKNVRKPLQIIHQEHEKKRISNPSSQLSGYLAFYSKHKWRMNRAQKKYQLYNIRRIQGKQKGLLELMKWAPPCWYGKEIKRWLAKNILD